MGGVDGVGREVGGLGEELIEVEMVTLIGSRVGIIMRLWIFAGSIHRVCCVSVSRVRIHLLLLGVPDLKRLASAEYLTT